MKKLGTHCILANEMEQDKKQQSVNGSGDVDDEDDETFFNESESECKI